VALVVEWLDAWRGGAETSTLQFLHQLVERGVEVDVFTRSRPSPRPGLNVHTVSGASMSRTRKSVTFAHRVERMLAESPFDVVHAISPCRAATVYQPRGGTVAESIERNLALLSTAGARHLKRYANRFNFKQRYLLRLEREILGPNDGPLVVAISGYVEDQLRRHYDLSADRTRKIYNAVEPDQVPAEERIENRRRVRQEYGIGEQELLIIQVAHNFKLKGVRRWMEALSDLLSRGVADVRSLIIGRGESEKWHRLCARLGLGRHLAFTGPTERVRAFLHAADALVHPTYYDPCSRVVLEGMVSGLPCITTRWDGAAEMIRPGENGFVLEEPAETNRLAEIVLSLREEDFRRSIGRAAAAIADEVSMARHASRILDLYKNMIEVPQSAGR
jgi:UDP-glucose:(heptosyl)LPS alpha-1,3-glucosyltransferase